MLIDLTDFLNQRDRDYCIGMTQAPFQAHFLTSLGLKKLSQVNAGGLRDASSNTNWRGHDDVMQIRSFRGSGVRVWVNTL